MKAIEEERAEMTVEPVLEENPEKVRLEKQTKFIKQLTDSGYSEALAVKAYYNASAEDIANEDISEGNKFITDSSHFWQIRVSSLVARLQVTVSGWNLCICKKAMHR